MHLKPILRWLASFFAWRFVCDTGVWVYRENRVTGQRSVTRSGTGHQPIDMRWLCRQRGLPPDMNWPRHRMANKPKKPT